MIELIIVYRDWVQIRIKLILKRSVALYWRGRFEFKGPIFVFVYYLPQTFIYVYIYIYKSI